MSNNVYPSIKKRVLAFLIDVVTLGVVPGMIIYYTRIKPYDIGISLELTCWLVFTIASITLLFFLKGSSLGGIVFRIKVVSQKEEGISVFRVAIRTLIYCILLVNAIFSLIGVLILVIATSMLFSAPFSEKKLTAWDLITKTVVICY